MWTVPIPAKLYRFCSDPERDLITLAKGCVYYASPPQLNDPFDCQLSLDSNVSDEEKHAAVFYMMLTAREKTGTIITFSTDEDFPFQQRFDYLCEDFLTCMFKYGIPSLSAAGDHPLMWSHYGDAFRGFALAYDTSRPIDPAVLRTTFQVQYRPEVPRISLLEMLDSQEAFVAARQQLLTVKGPAWDYEREWRVIIWPGEREERRPFAVSAVIFGHLLEENHRETLRTIFGPDVTYQVAAPAERKFEVEFHDADSGRRRIPGLARPHRQRSTYFYNQRYRR
jgi:hypothetical protein